MTMLVAWIVFPLVLCVLALGCGLLMETVAGFELTTGLLLPVGLAVMIVVASLATMTAATATLATPAVVVCAVAGLGLTAPWRGRRPNAWLVVAALGVFAVYAAPIVLSGQATFSGYITLDDTATWLALIDRALEHGRSLDGLQASTYEATLDSYVRKSGYPIGSFLPLGVGSKLVGTDTAWLFQPYIAWVAAILASSLYALVRGLVESPRLRAVVAFVAAQSALLYGYAMWSGIKEVTSAMLIVVVASLLPAVVKAPREPAWRLARRVSPLAVTIAAALAALSVGGIVWLLPALALAVAAAARLDARAALAKAIALTVPVVVLSLPALVIAGAFIRQETGTSSLTSAAEVGNLFHRLSWLQFLGVWPAGEFRGRPQDIEPTYVLLVVVALAAAAGLWWAWRRRGWSLLLYTATAGIGAFLLILKGSPWVDGKALATASPAALVAAMTACGAAFERGRRVEATVVAGLIAGGVLWSNALAYRNVWLAPASQLAELETIGRLYAGQGPTLMTEYNSYGARHFLRRLDPEAASELRRRVIPLLNGQPLEPGESADLDRFQLGAILVYKTIVLRRSPTESRPPAPYELVRRGRAYDVWQRPDTYPRVLQHLPLGDLYDPAAVPRCSDVLRLARGAGPAGRLAAAARRPVVLVAPGRASLPTGWQRGNGDAVVSPRGAGTVDVDVAVPSSGRYSFWVGGSFRDRLRLSVDGRLVADERHRLNNAGMYTPLRSADLTRGTHHIKLRYGGPDLHPGSGGFQFDLGPLVVAAETDDVPVTFVPAADARSLCGKRLDWIEAFAAQSQ